MTPTAELFWSSVIRHLFAAVAGVLVTHGYVTQVGANAYVEELIGVVLYAAGQLWANRAAYTQRVKMLTALWMPHGTTEACVDEHIAKGLPTPALSTPPNTVPGVPDAKT